MICQTIVSLLQVWILISVINFLLCLYSTLHSLLRSLRSSILSLCLHFSSRRMQSKIHWLCSRLWNFIKTSFRFSIFSLKLLMIQFMKAKSWIIAAVLFVSWCWPLLVSISQSVWLSVFLTVSLTICLLTIPITSISPSIMCLFINLIMSLSLQRLHLYILFSLFLLLIWFSPT